MNKVTRILCVLVASALCNSAQALTSDEANARINHCEEIRVIIMMAADGVYMRKTPRFVFDSVRGNKKSPTVSDDRKKYLINQVYFSPQLHDASLDEMSLISRQVYMECVQDESNPTYTPLR